MSLKSHYHIEVWQTDGTILSERDTTTPFPKFEVGEQVIFDSILQVKEVLDSSNEADGTVYFRRIVRVG